MVSHGGAVQVGRVGKVGTADLPVVHPLTLSRCTVTAVNIGFVRAYYSGIELTAAGYWLNISRALNHGHRVSRASNHNQGGTLPRDAESRL